MFFKKNCRHRRHLAFYSYSLSKEELDAEAFLCSWPQETERYLIHAPWCLYHFETGAKSAGHAAFSRLDSLSHLLQNHWYCLGISDQLAK